MSSYNLLERAFGWNPNNGTDKLPEPQRLPDGTFTVTIPQVERHDTRVLVEASPDGVSWTAVRPTGRGPYTATAAPRGPQPAMRCRAQRMTPWKEP